MRMDRFKKVEPAIEKALSDNGMKCYGIMVAAFQAKYLVSRSSGQLRLEEPLAKCVESLIREFGQDTGFTFCMYPGDDLLSPYLVVRETETGVWP